MGLIRSIKEPWWALKRFALRAREAGGDRRLGIDTTVVRFNSPGHPERSPYEPVHYEALAIIDERVSVSDDEVFYDLGCGKGRVLCHYALKPIRSATGVEYGQSLYEAARRNLDGLKGKKAQEWHVLHNDVQDVDLSDATLIFMFNPFGREIMRSVLRKVSGKSGLRIVYAGPAQAPVFDEFPALEIIDQFKVPYDLGSMDVIVWRHG